jgi:hypothetical protein
MKSLQWIRQALTSELKQVPFDFCFQLLPKLRAHTYDNWRHLVAGDKNWFYYEYARDGTWTAWDDSTPELEKKIIAPGKVYE